MGLSAHTFSRLSSPELVAVRVFQSQQPSQQQQQQQVPVPKTSADNTNNQSDTGSRKKRCLRNRGSGKTINTPSGKEKEKEKSKQQQASSPTTVEAVKPLAGCWYIHRTFLIKRAPELEKLIHRAENGEYTLLLEKTDVAVAEKFVEWLYSGRYKSLPDGDAEMTAGTVPDQVVDKMVVLVVYPFRACVCTCEILENC